MRTKFIGFQVYFIFFMMLTFMCLHADWNLTIQADHDENTIETQLLPVQFPVLIHQISINVDTGENDNELRYLIGFSAGQMINAGQLKQAVLNLKKKNKFETINIQISKVANGYVLNFNFVSFWQFKKMKFYGSYEQQQYRHHYQFEAGMPFDVEKHNNCIKSLENALRDDGYLSAHVINYLTYEYEKKLIIPHIILQTDIRYRIGNVDTYIDTQILPVSDQKDLIKKINKLFVKNMIGTYFSRLRFNKTIVSIKEYLVSKGFSDVIITLNESIDNINARIYLRLKLHIRKQKQIIIRGNQFFSKKQLCAKIVDFYRISDCLPDQFLKMDLLQKYHKHGFWHANIEIVRNGKLLFITINEGPRVSITNIVIKGCTYQNPKKLIRKFFLSCVRKKFFDAHSVKESLLQLLMWYSKKGFWQIKVLKQSFNRLENPNEYELEITIDEGKQQKLNKVICPEFPELINQMPFTHCHTRKPVPFDHHFLTQQRQWLMQQFNKQGYLNAQIWHELQDGSSGVDVIWHVNTGKQTIFGKTIITGMTQLSYLKIQSILDYKEGEPWNKDKISNSFERLQQLEMFETVSARAEDSDNNPRSILLKLVDDDPFEVRVRFGFQQVSKNLTFRQGTTYKVGGAFIFKNPSNSADVLRFDADVTRFYRNLCLQYTRPWNFDLPIWFKAKGYSNTYLQPVVQGTAKTLYEAFQQGFLIGLSNRFSHFDWGCNIGLESMETSKLSKELALAINFAPTLIDKKALLLFLEPNVLIDFLNDKVNPSQGSLSMISGKLNIPFDRRGVTFFKILAEQSLFTSFNAIIFGLHVRIGHVFGQQFMHIMPPDRFYLGGENSLRGYRPDQAPPLGIFVDGQGKRLLVPQGGKSMFNLIFEVRFPIIWQFLQGALFQDFGVLIGDSFSNFKEQWGLAATGFGLRYLAPIGPIRFDIGFKWKKRDPEENRFAWFLTLGQSF